MAFTLQEIIMTVHSIIIPTAGRPKSIRSAIESILIQELKFFRSELIIVDNNTEDALSSDLANYCEQWSSRLRYVREPSPGLSAARHRGALEAKGDLLTFLDDDVEVSHTWLQGIHNAFKSKEVAMVGGPSIPKFTCSVPAWFWGFMNATPYGGWMNDWLSLLDIGRDINNVDPNYIWGLNFSIRKQVLFDCGGFHPDLVPEKYQRWQGDGETGLTRKVKALGLRANYRQDVLVNHLCGPDRLNLEYFKKRAYYQGVCDSYTQKRDQPLGQVEPGIYPRINSRIGRILRWLTGQNSWSRVAAEVRVLTDEAYQAGRKFHYDAVASDPSLFEWIRRENYFNTDIRDFIQGENGVNKSSVSKVD